jgi:hypothetical protein
VGYTAIYYLRPPIQRQKGNQMLSTVTLPPTNNYSTERFWNLKDLWHAAERLPVFKVSVDKLWRERYAKVFCWQLNDEAIDNEFFLHHMQRILDADLDYPIILSEEDYIFDGVHRLLKCKYLNIEYIKCSKFTKDPEAKIRESIHTTTELSFLKKLKQCRQQEFNNEPRLTKI